MKILVMFVIPVELRWLVVMYVIYDMFPLLRQLGGAGALDQVAHAAHLGGLAYGFLYKRFDLRYSRLMAGWNLPRWKRLAKTATRRKGYSRFRPFRRSGRSRNSIPVPQRKSTCGSGRPCLTRTF